MKKTQLNVPYNICVECGGKTRLFTQILHKGVGVVGLFYVCGKCYEKVYEMEWFPVGEDSLRASEAVYGFVAWLTTRKEKTVMSSHDECGSIAELVAKFVRVNRLTKPRDRWTRKLVHPRD